MKNIILLSSFLIILSCNSQPPTTNSNDFNKSEYLDLVYERCPEADILEIEQKEDYTEIEYLCNEKYYEIGINNHQVIYMESKVSRSELPIDKIQNKIEKKYPGWLLDEISLISTNDTSFLKVEIIKDGLEQNLFFTTTGKKYKSNTINITHQWTIKKLSSTPLFQQAPYNFLQPNHIYYLPKILLEVSGIALSEDEQSVFCVQDELGAVFEYNFSENKIKNIHRFTDVGDFEEITRKNSWLYILRSDGKIYSFNYKNKQEIKQFVISINAMNFESLTYDKTKGRFLIISKDALLNQPESKRVVHQLSAQKMHHAESYLEIDLYELNEKIPADLKKEKDDIALFKPSSIAVHPITNEIYVLSASDRLLAVFNQEGVKKVYPLPAELYYKPEGLEFYENGDLLISSEGEKKGLLSGNIVFLKYK